MTDSKNNPPSESKHSPQFASPLSRRTVLTSAAMGLAALAVPGTLTSLSRDRTARGRIPVVHTTDLYHPPQDPDDQIDLATLLALDELDVRGVVLDVTERFLTAAPAGFDIPRDPGFLPVAQINYLLGRAIPAAAGPMHPLHHPNDTIADRPTHEQAGINLLLDILDRSNEPVLITVLGSARTVTAAFNREPELMRTKTRAVILNAGSTGGPKTEWNVGLDLHAYVGLWRSGLPMFWYPCGTDKSAFVRAHDHGTYWNTSHEALFRDLPEKLRAWFAYGFSGSARSDFIRALNEVGRGEAWEQILSGKRNMWSTASLVMAAGRVLTQTPDGWRFLPGSKATDVPVWPWELKPIRATVSDEGNVDWTFDTSSRSVSIFRRRPDAEFGDAMAQALNALLRSMPV